MPNTYTELASDVTMVTSGSNQAAKRRLTLQTTTAQYALEVFVLNQGDAQVNTSLKVRVYFVTTNLDNPTTENYRDLYGPNAKYMDVFVDPQVKTGFLVGLKSTPPFVPTGPNLIVWFEYPACQNGLSFYCYVTEIPN